MVAIALLSHGNMAEGVLDSYRLFNGDESAIACCSLSEKEAPDAYYERLKSLFETLDQGDGILILCDIPGGTPANMAQALSVGRKVEIVSGMNLMMVIDASLKREWMDLDTLYQECIKTGKESVMHLVVQEEDIVDEEVEF